jgi:radical SAM protein with 4Fe4S-binding SPASM domain
MIKTSNNIPVLKMFPGRITLELTNNCNFNCTFCPRRLMSQELGFMSIDLARKLIDEMAAHLPVTLVPFFRGEPLLHPGWDRILQYAKTRGIGPIQLTTNGSLLTEAAAAQIVNLEVDFISFSLDTVDPQLYEKSRRGSRYEYVVNNILKFISLKQRNGKLLPEVQVSAVETEEHKPGMDDFISFWRNKVDRVRIYAEHSTGDHPGNIGEELPSFTTRKACFKPFEELVVLWNGDVALCNHDWNREGSARIGNLYDMSIEEIWQSDRYTELRDKHRTGDLKGETVCENCDHWKMYHIQDGFIGKLYKPYDIET